MDECVRKVSIFTSYLSNKYKYYKLETDVDFRDQLYKAITKDFVSYVKVHSVLDIFLNSDAKIFTVPDIEKIQKSNEIEGEREGSRALLKYLIVYRGWFPCLLTILRHPEVKLKHVADKLQRIHDEQLAAYEAECPSNADEIKRQGSKQDIEWAISGNPQSQDPLSTLMLEDDPYENDSASFAEDGLPGQASKSEEMPSQPSKPDDATSTEKEPTSSGSTTDDTNVYLVPSESSNSLYENVRPAAERPKTPPVEQIPPCGRRPLPPLPPNEHAPHPPPERLPNHGPEYDFTLDETSMALGTYAGWHPNITEQQIHETLRKLWHQDGHYILWYWHRKKRPGLCVTFRNKIKTFIAHKRPPKVCGEATKFYFMRNGHEEQGLAALVSYHLREGVKDSSNNVTHFTSPVLYNS